MKLLVSDIDGTLFPSKYAKNPNQLEDNLAAIKKWISLGNQFALATARNLRDYQQFKELFGCDLNFVGANGAGILFEDGSKQELYINSTIYFFVLDYVEEHDLDASVVCSSNQRWLWKDMNHYPFTTDHASEEIRKSVTLIKENDVLPNTSITKVSIFVAKEDRDQLKEELESFGFNASFTTCDVDMIDIIPRNASKANGILELCKHYQIAKEDVYVVGDSENDISMFTVTDNSYCIDHAEEKVKNSATHVVASVSEMIESILDKDL